MMKKIVSFDFDGTLTREDVKAYAKKLTAFDDVEVWVITRRFDDLHAHWWVDHPTNDDLWETVDSIGIPRHHVKFTNMHSKAEFLRDTFVLWHLDDDPHEVEEIFNMPACDTVPILVDNSIKDSTYELLSSAVLLGILPSLTIQKLKQTNGIIKPI